LIAKMKRAAYLVNTARGKICDRDAMPVTCGSHSPRRAVTALRLHLADLPVPQPAPGALESMLRAAVRSAPAPRPRWQHPSWCAWTRTRGYSQSNSLVAELATHSAPLGYHWPLHARASDTRETDAAGERLQTSSAEAVSGAA
jgi:hypothetical protein